MIRRASVLILLALPVWSCGGEPSSGSYAGSDFCGPVLAKVDSFMAASASSDPDPYRYGGMVVVATVGDLFGMGPSDASDVASAEHQQYVNLMTLVEFNEELEPVPYLARAWEISEDNTEVTFHLRDDVYWHDGEPTTAYDVAFTFRTVTNPESGYANPGNFQAYLPDPEGMEVVDSSTIIFRFRPHAEMLETWRTLPILPEHLLGEVPTAELANHPYSSVCPVGNGPFRFVSRNPGESWTFQANPAFPTALGGRPYVDRYVYRYIPDHTTLLAEFLTGGVDVYVQMLPNHAETVREEPGFRVESFPYPSIFFIAWNSRVPKLSDARVRRALTQGINREQLIQGVQGGEAVLLNSGVPPVHWAYIPELGDSLPYDPEASRALLAEAGWVDRDGDGVRENEEGEPLHLELLYNQNLEREQVGEIVRVQLQEIGVELEPVVMELGAYSDALLSEAKDFEAAFVTFEIGFRNDERDLFHSEVGDAGWAFSGTHDSELDRYLDTLQLIPDREEALPIWRAYQYRILQVQPYTFLYSAYRRDGLNDRIQDAVMDTRGDWATIRHWWIRPEDRTGR